VRQPSRVGRSVSEGGRDPSLAHQQSARPISERRQGQHLEEGPLHLSPEEIVS
jgi:hypothetical protein